MVHPYSRMVVQNSTCTEKIKIEHLQVLELILFKSQVL